MIRRLIVIAALLLAVQPVAAVGEHTASVRAETGWGGPGTAVVVPRP